MNLAVLGTDPDLLALLAAAKVDGHQIVWLSDVRSVDQPAIRQLATSSVNTSSEWETLLDHATADAVLVGRGTADEELRTEQLKRLVADAVPLLVVHPPCLSVLTYYELDMVRRETRGILRHYNPLHGHPSLSDLSRWVREGHETIGEVRQVTCTREVRDGSRETVLAGLARDAELLAFVAGGIQHVSAVGPRGENASYASLQVQMTAPDSASISWSAVPKFHSAGRTLLTLVADHGSIEWSQATQASSDDGQQLEYNLQIATSESQQESLPPHNAALAAIRQLAEAVDLSERSTDADDEIRSTWDTATRSMEVVDAVELSLQKGRTIEVHQQKLTEQLAFRGTMAALGCGLLLVVTTVMIIAGVVGGLESLLQHRVMKSWALVLLAVLAFFLLLQVVPYLSTKRRDKKPLQSESDSDERQL